MAARPESSAQLRSGEIAVSAALRVQDRLGKAGHRLSIRGQGDRMGVAYEQAAASLFLQPAHVLADGGWHLLPVQPRAVNAMTRPVADLTAHLLERIDGVRTESQGRTLVQKARERLAGSAADGEAQTDG